MREISSLILPVGLVLLVWLLLDFGSLATVGVGLRPLSSSAIDALTMIGYLGIAWLLSRVSGLVLSRLRPKSRPLPKLLRELVTAVLFLVALISGAMLLMGHSPGSALAGSGVALAVLGFAIRNVVADILSGVALGFEGPFRIGDWVDIEGLARGRVVDIGWRTTRLLTRDSTYVILPNSQISRQRIVNYSAPRSDFRAQIEILVGRSVPIPDAAEVLLSALQKTVLIKSSPSPDIRVLAIEPQGIRYALRYWVERFDYEVDCRDAIWREVDKALRAAKMNFSQEQFAIIPLADGANELLPDAVATFSPRSNSH